MGTSDESSINFERIFSVEYDFENVSPSEIKSYENDLEVKADYCAAIPFDSDLKLASREAYFAARLKLDRAKWALKLKNLGLTDI